ncbi:HAD family hydrolase [Paenibacillus sp. BR2-3]|uniref:HAD family hydrolase n=1 Tax=Paenibacillus sp. BR2-3 TaxID=3048494 RepID=UPI003977370F
MKEVYESSFRTLFSELKISYDTSDAVKILFKEHTFSHFYNDTVDFLESISRTYKVCIVSDADVAMIPDISATYGAQLFTSEQYQSYKNDDRNIMFKEVLKSYNVHPKQVLHIGDSASDVLGANREGISTCWINRNKRTWDHEIQPDFIVESLNKIEEILRGQIHQNH